MKKIMTFVCAMLVTAGAAAQNNDGNNADLTLTPSKADDRIHLKIEQGNSLTLAPTDEDSGTDTTMPVEQKDNTPLYLVKTPDGKLVPATTDTINTKLIKSVTVFKSREASEQFAEYGDISNGVVVVEIKYSLTNADVTLSLSQSSKVDDYFRMKVKQDTLTFTLNNETSRKATIPPVSNTGTPLYLATTGYDDLKRVSVDTVEQKQIESISVFKNASAGQFAEYGDISNGVVVVTIKKVK